MDGLSWEVTEGGRGDAMSHLFPAQNTVASRASHLMDIPFPIHVSAIPMGLGSNGKRECRHSRIFNFFIFAPWMGARPRPPRTSCFVAYLDPRLAYDRPMTDGKGELVIIHGFSNFSFFKRSQRRMGARHRLRTSFLMADWNHHLWTLMIDMDTECAACALW